MSDSSGFEKSQIKPWQGAELVEAPSTKLWQTIDIASSDGKTVSKHEVVRRFVYLSIYLLNLFKYFLIIDVLISLLMYFIVFLCRCIDFFVDVFNYLFISLYIF